jgi:Tfp pilus assembly PilM family ATPase
MHYQNLLYTKTFCFKFRLINKKPIFVLLNNLAMSTKTKSTDSSNANLAIPNQVITIDQLQVEIKKAEKEKFQTVQESMQVFEKWLTSRERK